MHNVLLILLSALFVHCLPAGAEPAKDGPANTTVFWRAPAEGQRLLAVISDLHAGIGRKPNGTWHETEDFRWETEIEAFLSALSQRGKHNVDLIIAGDLLELWQPPADIRCENISYDLSCSVEKMREITQRVVDAQTRLTKALKEFALHGDNRIHIIPGNHDSALLLASVWEPLAQKLGVESGRINLVGNGVWISQDKKVLVEHGHQIGEDLNRYDSWPEITRKVEGKVYLVRPWGENFVQTIFNEKESSHPIIDNLSPETAGLRYYLAERGLLGSAADIARFLVFNLTETSLAQKDAALGQETDNNQTDNNQDWNPDYVREKGKGHLLFAAALGDENSFTRAMMADTPEASKLRAELDALVTQEKRLSRTELLLLCDQAAERDNMICRESTAGFVLQKVFKPRDRVMRDHLTMRLKQYNKMKVFIYGHTHELETRRSVKIDEMSSVDVLNSGAFQRLVDEKGYLKRVKPENRAEGLSILKHDDLPPCYTVVLMPAYDDRPQTVRWYMPLDKAGEFVSVGDSRCD